MAQVSGYFQSYDATARPNQVNGIDVSHYQLDYAHNFVSAYDASAQFVIMKAGGMIKTTFTARYIRCAVNGSYTNTDSLFTLVRVYDVYGVDQATGVTVSGSVATASLVSGDYSDIVDGSTATYVNVGTATQYVWLDLGATATNLDEVMVWHYAGRKFKNNTVEFSEDASTWYNLFDSDVNGEYDESNPAGTFVGCNFKIGSSAIWAVDNTFTADNIASARAAGLKVGAYFFKDPSYCYSGAFLNSAGDASSQASVFWQYITSALGTSDWTDTFVWLDWENPDGRTIFPCADNDESYVFIKTFCDTIKALTSGRQCGVYLGWFNIDGQATSTADALVHSTSGGIGSVCPLWYAQSVDINSSYPTYYGWSQGQFGGWAAWTMWQFSYNNSSADRFGFASGDLDLDICEGDLVNILKPSDVTGFTSGTIYASAINVTWTSSESDIRGYYLLVSGQSTATISTGITSGTVSGLTPNTSYAVAINAYDLWEIGDSTSITVDTTSAFSGYYTLFSTFAASATVYIVYDSFDRANNPSSLGTADTGQAWSVLEGAGQMGIVSQAAQLSALTNNCYVTLESSTAEHMVQVDLAHKDIRTGNFYFFVFYRVANASNHNLFGSPTNATYYLTKKVANTYYTIGNTTTTPNTNDLIQIVASGDYNDCYVNSALLLSVHETSNTTGTRCGIGCYQSSSAFDNFYVYPTSSL